MKRSILAIVAVSLLSADGVAQSAEVQQLYQRARDDSEAGRFDQAIVEYKRILGLAPDIAPAYNNLGRLYFNLDRFADAATVLKRGLLIDPSMHAAEVILGASYLQLARPDEAVPLLQRAVQAMPTDRFAHFTLAQALIRNNQPDEAIAELKLILKLHPEDQEVWYTLGKLQLQLSQVALTRAQAIDPNTPLAHQLAGEVMESMGNTPGAVAEYKLALAAAPDDTAALNHLASLYWSTGDWLHAQESLRTVVAKEPGSCIAHWHLANTLDELDTSQAEATTEIEVALKECPDLIPAHAERGRLLLRTGKPDAAVADLLQAERGLPDEPSIQRLLAQAYRALGNRAAADRANARYEELNAAEHTAKERHAAAVVQATP